MGSILKSTGSCLPLQRIHNNDLPKTLETTHEWIEQRTGIQTRHIANETETASVLATKAVQNAITKGNIASENVDLLIVATVTGDLAFPSVANLVQKNLQLKNAVAFDINAACSGFVYAMDIADKFLKSKQYKCAVVVGVDIFSKILDWNDRSTCVLFGDGAGAGVLEYVDSKDIGILSSHIFSDGNYSDLLRSSNGICEGAKNSVIMNGKEVFKFAVTKMKQALNIALSQNNLSVNDITWLVPHQANKRIIEALIDYTKIDKEKVLQTVTSHANTSAASIPLALDTLDFSKMKSGDIVAIVSMGAGFTWGASIIRF